MRCLDGAFLIFGLQDKAFGGGVLHTVRVPFFLRFAVTAACERCHGRGALRRRFVESEAGASCSSFGIALSLRVIQGLEAHVCGEHVVFMFDVQGR